MSGYSSTALRKSPRSPWLSRDPSPFASEERCKTREKFFPGRRAQSLQQREEPGQQAGQVSLSLKVWQRGCRPKELPAPPASHLFSAQGRLGELLLFDAGQNRLHRAWSPEKPGIEPCLLNSRWNTSLISSSHAEFPPG